MNLYPFNLYTKLQVLSSILIDRPKEIQHVLGKMLESLDIRVTRLDEDRYVKDELYNTLECILEVFEYYDSSELTVSMPLNIYLGQVLKDMWDGKFEDQTTLAMNICGRGNKTEEALAGEAIGNLTEEAFNIINRFEDILLEEVNYRNNDDLVISVKRLEYLDKVLRLVDIFVTAKTGYALGQPEYPLSALQGLEESPEPDFTLPSCGKEEDCDCGCKLEHPILVLEGMEDYLSGRDTPASVYFLGVGEANNIRLSKLVGNEGKIFDSIKQVGRNAWDQLVKTMTAIKDSFNDKDDAAKLEAAEESADANKKAFQAMEPTPAVINSTAKESLIALATNSDISGKFKEIVSNFNTPSDGPRIIDALLGLMSKSVNSNSELNKELTDANKAVADLKTATDASSTGDESNKEVVAANKAKVTDATKNAKDAVKELKGKLGQHNKLTAGIKKAITGINPKIFIAKEDK